MTEDGAESPTEGILEATEPESPLPLQIIDRQLSAIRRVVAYGCEHPESVRFVEANFNRWLDPLLHLELPEALREAIVGLAGQVSGFDVATLQSKQARLARLRAHIFELERILGLPLPAERRRRGRKDGKRDRRESPRQEPSGTERKAGLGERPKKAKARKEKSRMEASQPPLRSGYRFWNGNPYASLDTLAIDPSLIEALANVGILAVRDVLLRAPTDEEVIRPIHGAGREIEPGRVAVGGRVHSRCTVLKPNGTSHLEVVLVGAGPMKLRWQDSPRARSWIASLEPGERAVAVGEWDGEILLEPTFVTEDGKAVRLAKYGLEGVEDSSMHALVFRLLPYLDGARDPLPKVKRGARLGWAEAVRALHGRGSALDARNRLAYDEAVTLAVGLGWSRMSQRVRGIQHTVLHSAVDRVLSGLDTRLTDAQQRAFEDIKRDMRRNRPMRRVLCGNPGAGKGLISLLSAVTVAEGKCQVLWVTPDFVSAEFAFTFYEPLLKAAGLVARLAGEDAGASVKDAARRGEIHVLFGPASLLGAGFEFRRLGLVICAERDGMEASTDAVEALKSPRPDVLVVPSAPVGGPELIHGWPHFDVTVMEGAPTPDIVVRSATRRDAAYAPARQAVLEGRQVLVLFPQIQGRDALDLAEARRVVDALASEALKGARLALLHGSMSRDERARVLSDVNQRRADALVSTIPMEDGPPIPGHAITVVEHADRMSSHRLRRLCGLTATQISLVVGDEASEEEHDALRGRVAGLAVPSAESVWTGLQFFEPRRDLATLISARTVAFDLLSSDGGLRGGHHADLVRSMRAAWPQIFGDRPCPLPEVGDGGGNPKRRRRRRRRR